MEDQGLLAAAAGSQSPPPPPMYRSKAGEDQIAALYDKCLSGLPYAHEERLIETRFGTAQVMVCGPEAGPPLVIWHGMSAPAPYMIRMFDPLVKYFRIYLPDLPCQAGSRSQPCVLDPAKHELGQWCLEVLRALKLVPAEGTTPDNKGPPLPLHVGCSFGAAVTLELAQVAPEVIRAAALVVPGGLMPATPVPILLRVILPSLLYRLLPCSLTGRLALSGICDEPDTKALEGLLLAWRHFAHSPPLPGGHGGFSREQQARLAAPTLVIAAEKDVFWPGRQAAAAAAAALPDCRTIVMEGCKHLPAREKQMEMSEWILQFFADRGFVSST